MLAPGWFRDLRWRSPRRWDLSAALYNVEVEGVASADLARRLWQGDGIVFRPIRIHEIDGARISPNLHTRSADLEAFFRAVE